VQKKPEKNQGPPSGQRGKFWQSPRRCHLLLCSQGLLYKLFITGRNDV